MQLHISLTDTGSVTCCRVRQNLEKFVVHMMSLEDCGLQLVASSACMPLSNL
jgi:hypothetical protein